MKKQFFFFLPLCYTTIMHESISGNWMNEEYPDVNDFHDNIAKAIVWAITPVHIRTA